MSDPTWTRRDVEACVMDSVADIWSSLGAVHAQALDPTVHDGSDAPITLAQSFRATHYIASCHVRDLVVLFDTLPRSLMNAKLRLVEKMVREFHDRMEGTDLKGIEDVNHPAMVSALKDVTGFCKGCFRILHAKTPHRERHQVAREYVG